MKTIEVVAAVIRHGNQVFATQRGYGEFEGGWEFPGGKMEPGETPQEALIREIKEELDTEIEVGELIETVEYDYPKFHLTMHCFMCTVKSGHLVLKEMKPPSGSLKTPWTLWIGCQLMKELSRQSNRNFSF